MRKSYQQRKPQPKKPASRFYASPKKGIVEGFRSGLEKINQDHLKAKGVPYGYENHKIPFIEPEKLRHYTPDFFLENGIVVETKGRFLSKDRQKMLLVQEQHPDLEIRFVFSRATTPIYTRSKTTCAMWAEKLIPDGWILEPINPEWVAAVRKLKK